MLSDAFPLFTQKCSHTLHSVGIFLPGKIKAEIWPLDFRRFAVFRMVAASHVNFKLTNTCNHQSVVLIMFALVAPP